MPAPCPPRGEGSLGEDSSRAVPSRDLGAERDCAPATTSSALSPTAVSPTGQWVVLLPLKPLARAKTRLRRPDRGTLALAMALDTVSAALAVGVDVVAAILLVTNDPDARTALARHVAGTQDAGRVRVIAEGDGSGLNPALRHAATVARRRWPSLGVAALSADLAALRPAELRRALRCAPAAGRGLVADATGTGTVLLTASPGLDLAPSFGPDSRHAHLASGAVDLTAPLGDDIQGLRRDVDTVDDLVAADRLGVGPATGAVLRSRS